ncbi:FmdE family protein [Litorilituus sediminis]|nr:FmdE family protein [Litorilituus sediminis]
MMKYPDYYTQIEPIILKDDLANFLGAFDQGLIEFTFVDIVKSAGHACPTVLGAYLMTLQGLKALYGKEVPKRGEILVSFSQKEDEGVAGVIANVVGQITGATVSRGFKGLAGQFDRRNLMSFEQNIEGSVCFTRIDNQESVTVSYDASSVPADPEMPALMQASIQGLATKEQQVRFTKLWQKRVAAIAENVEHLVKVTRA